MLILHLSIINICQYWPANAFKHGGNSKRLMISEEFGTTRHQDRKEGQ